MQPPASTVSQITGKPLTLTSRRELEDQIARQVAAERARLEQQAGVSSEVRHFKRPGERAFTASERGQVTILIGGLT
jgi:hypothetical protein